MDTSNLKDSPIEGVDLAKVRHIIRTSKWWLALILIITNAIAILILRYTKDVYESETVIKLDLEKNASEIGIKSLASDVSTTSLISGEIEVIQSRLFLSRVLDSMDLTVSFYSTGHVLDFDLFGTEPVHINHLIKDQSYYNRQIFYIPEDENTYHLKVHEQEYTGHYGKTLSLPWADLTLTQNPTFESGGELGYYFIINSRDALLNYLSSHLTVQPLNFNANTIRVAFQDYNIQKAHDIVTKIDDLYVSYSADQNNLANKQKIDWVNSELRRIEDRMENYEGYFKDYLLKNKSTSVDDELRNTIIFINAIDSQRYQVSSQIALLNKAADEFQSNTLISIPNNLPATISQNLTKIQEIMLDQDRLKLSYNEETHAYRQKQNTINSLKAKTLDLINRAKSDNLIKLQELNRRKSKYENDFASMPDRRNEYSKNERFYKLYEEFYLLLMKSKSEFEVAIAGTTPDFKILTPATLSNRPIYPSRYLIMGIGFSSGFVIILFFIGISYVVNDKITNLPEIERAVKIPVVGVVPSSKSLKRSVIHVTEHPKSMVSESIRIVRTNLDFFKVQNEHKIIAISSTISGEGKSFIALNLAGVIAQSSKKVVLIDLDMRKPKTELPVKIDDRSKGVSTVLIGKHAWKDVVTGTTIENLDYIASGPHPPNPSELLLNKEFTDLLVELKSVYDFIILDTPPVGLVTDGIMAMKQADISIYIFRANYSKQYFPENLNRIITINKFTNITLLLNALPAGSERGYGYGYYEDPAPPKWYNMFFKRR